MVCRIGRWGGREGGERPSSVAKRIVGLGVGGGGADIVVVGNGGGGCGRRVEGEELLGFRWGGLAALFDSAPKVNVRSANG